MLSPPGGECQSRGLSVYTVAEDAARQRRAPTLRGLLICAITLDEGAGPLYAYASRNSHFTWWPRQGFDILGNAEVVG